MNAMRKVVFLSALFFIVMISPLAFGQRAVPPAPDRGQEPVPGAAQAPVNPNAIVEGVGWRDFRVGATHQELLAALGPPDNGSLPGWLQWKRKYHIHCLIDEKRGAFELRFDPGFPGRLTTGVVIGSSEIDLMRTYGRPNQLTTKGAGAKKYEYSQKGVLFWTNRGKVTQIVVFKPYQLRAREP